MASLNNCVILHCSRPAAAAAAAASSMFVSLPQYKFHVPAGLADPGASYWRALSVSTSAAWFVMSLRERQKDALSTTVLLAWDTDIGDAIRSMGEVDVESVLVVASHVQGESRGWFSKQITEIWEASDPRNPGFPCVLFVGEDGTEYSGHFLQDGARVKRARLIARVKAATQCSRSRSGREAN